MNTQQKYEAALIAKSLLEILAAVCAIYATPPAPIAKAQSDPLPLRIREIRDRENERLPCDLCPKPASARGVLIHGIRWNLCQECFGRSTSETAKGGIPGRPRLAEAL